MKQVYIATHTHEWQSSIPLVQKNMQFSGSGSWVVCVLCVCFGIYVIVHVCIVSMLVCVSSGWSWKRRQVLQEGSGPHSQPCDLWAVCYPIRWWRVPTLQESLPGLLRTLGEKPPRRYPLFWTRSVGLICLSKQIQPRVTEDQGCLWPLGGQSYILLGGPITAKPSLTYRSL